MILFHNVLQLKSDKAREATALMKETEALAKRHGNNTTRYLTDVTGPFYTFVMEMTFDNLAVLEKSQNDMTALNEFANWYQKFIPLVESGHRKIFKIVSQSSNTCAEKFKKEKFCNHHCWRKHGSVSRNISSHDRGM